MAQAEMSLEEREKESVRAVIRKDVPQVASVSWQKVAPKQGAKVEDLLATVRILLDETDARGEREQNTRILVDGMRGSLDSLQRSLRFIDDVLIALLGEKDGVPKPVVMEAVTALLKERKVAMPDPGPRRDALVYRTIVVALSDYLKAVRGR